MAGGLTADEAFSGLVEALAGHDGVDFAAGKRGFGAGTLQVGGRIFAMVSQGRLVMKMPRERVAELIAEGSGSPFDAGKGKPMQEWVVLEHPTQGGALSLAQEALAFVGQR
jgi:hypothetical protein